MIGFVRAIKWPESIQEQFILTEGSQLWKYLGGNQGKFSNYLQTRIDFLNLPCTCIFLNIKYLKIYYTKTLK